MAQMLLCKQIALMKNVGVCEKNMPTIPLDKNLHADCAPDSYSKGQKGITFYKSTVNPYLNPNGGSCTISWTGTRPKCYNSSDKPSVCNISFDTLINSNASTDDVEVQYTLNGRQKLGPIWRSKIQGHDLTSIVDISQYPNYYNDVGLNSIVFTNKSGVGVWINNFRIMRQYAMCDLGTDWNGLCINPNNVGCSAGAASSSSGSLDATRNDCPCNFTTGGGLSANTYHSYSGAGSLIAYGSTLTWVFQNPDYEQGQTPNYKGPAACFFNLNNITLKANSPDNDVCFQFNLNGSSIASMYNSRLNDHTSSAGIDLVKFSQYNDAPKAFNTLQVSNKTPSTTLYLQDGMNENDAGRINIYRVYNVTNLMQQSCGACETSCQSCYGCQSGCQSGCQFFCVTCDACYGFCQGGCQDCQSGCEVGCQNGYQMCQHSCQTCQTVCESCASCYQDCYDVCYEYTNSNNNSSQTNTNNTNNQPTITTQTTIQPNANNSNATQQQATANTQNQNHLRQNPNFNTAPLTEEHVKEILLETLIELDLVVKPHARRQITNDQT
jgi:hypothetical protein